MGMIIYTSLIALYCLISYIINYKKYNQPEKMIMLISLIVLIISAVIVNLQ